MASVPCYDAFDLHYAQHVAASASRPLERRTLLELAGPLQGRDVIDLACGSGDFGRYLLLHGARSALGVDLSAAMIEQARQLSAQGGDAMQFLHGDATRLDMPARFDVAVAVWLFNHADTLQELERMYRAAASVLKPGGRLLGIVTHPAFRLAKGDFSRYGARIVRQQALDDHHLVEVAFADAAVARVTDHQWRADQHEQAAAHAGLPGLQWQAPVPTAAECKDRPPGFWDEYRDNNALVVLHARREG
ncbi:TPA: class I SAM-dependent methyltransferase [Stenotrophomonas maltophilia]|nr:class I SAM-dependent methyltransferase [Stenotrophomonas maltophilia]